jgi:hypothetical protein
LSDYQQHNHDHHHPHHHRFAQDVHYNYLKVSDIIVDCISLIVAFVPEGLPVAVTLTLSLIAVLMAKENVLVRGNREASLILLNQPGTVGSRHQFDAITLTLSLIAVLMAKENVLVRRSREASLILPIPDQSSQSRSRSSPSSWPRRMCW